MNRPTGPLNLTTPLAARSITAVGLIIELYQYWGDDCPHATLPDRAYNPHSATIIKRYPDQAAAQLAPHDPWDVADVDWPRRCDQCPALAPLGAIRSVFRSPLYDTPTGEPRAGDVFMRPCSRRCRDWDNCTGEHLIAVCPNGYHWDTTSRASNCTKPEDRTHRCWVVHGLPPAIHVDKVGHTCDAGAGSIAAPGIRGGLDWHGYLHNGQFVLA